MNTVLSKITMVLMLLSAVVFTSCDKENFDLENTQENPVDVEVVEVENTNVDCDNSFAIAGGEIDYNTEAVAIKYVDNACSGGFSLGANAYMVHSVDYDFFGATTAFDKLMAATDGLPGVLFGQDKPLEVGDVISTVTFPLLVDWTNWEGYHYDEGSVAISEVGNEVGEFIGGTVTMEIKDFNAGTTYTVEGSFCATIEEVCQ